MTPIKLKFLMFLIIFLIVFYITNAKISENTSFVATEDWQEIPEGMAIPAGLHIRINFQTRKREAKLLDKSEANENKNTAITLKDNHDINQNTFTSSKKSLLSDALKTLQKDGRSLKYSPENLSQIKRDFKVAKQGFAANVKNVRQNFQSDAEIITLLIEEYLNLTNPEHKSFSTTDERTKRQSQILDSFDYMLHQIDNSMLFVSQGGLDVLLPIVANETRFLRVKAMRVLGIVAQNNPKIQAEVFKQNFPNYILKTLISSSHTDELSTALYAFGSLIRKFPLAQRNILSTSGIKALVGVINREVELKVKVKAIIIISDILEEYHHMLSTSGDAENTEVVAQYKELKLYEWLKINGFCETVESAIVDEALQLFEQPDFVENIIEAIGNAYAFCKATWSQNSRMNNALLVIKSQYALSGDDYRIEIGQRISEIILILHNNRHQEL